METDASVAASNDGGFPTKTVVIRNIKDDDTVESLRTTLALDATPVVMGHTTITFPETTDTDVRTAHITTLDSVVPHLLALDGKLVDGRQWAVAEGAPEAAPAINNRADEDAGGPPQGGSLASQHESQEEPQEIQFMIIDCRSFAWIWNQVNIVEIISAVQVDHEEDYSKSIGRLKTGLWSLDSDNFERYVGKSIKIRGVDIPLTPKYKPRHQRGGVHWGYGQNRPTRREGTLVTIFGAYKRHNRSISGELFDQAFQSLHGVEVPRNLKKPKGQPY